MCVKWTCSHSQSSLVSWCLCEMMSVAVSKPCGAAPDVTAGLSHVVFTQTFLPKKKTKKQTKLLNVIQPQQSLLPAVKGTACLFFKRKKIGRPNSPELKQIMGSILLDFAGELAFKKNKTKEELFRHTDRSVQLHCAVMSDPRTPDKSNNNNKN